MSTSTYIAIANSGRSLHFPKTCEKHATLGCAPKRWTPQGRVPHPSVGMASNYRYLEQVVVGMLCAIAIYLPMPRPALAALLTLPVGMLEPASSQAYGWGYSLPPLLSLPLYRLTITIATITIAMAIALGPHYSEGEEVG